MTEEIKTQVDALGAAWEEFKRKNDERLAEIEKKGSADVLLSETLNKLNSSMDEAKKRIDAVETAQSRVAINSKQEQKDGGEYKAALDSYLRKGVEMPQEIKGMSVGSAADGGYLVTPAMSASIVERLYESSPLRQLATVETISTDSLDILVDNNQMTTGWVSESASRSATNTAQIGKKNIPAHEVYAMPQATQKLVDDSAIDVEAWIAKKVGDVFGTVEATAFISGSGVGQPRGILSYASGTSWGQIEQVNSGSSGAVTANGLIELAYSLKEPYAGGSAFLMRRATEADVRQLVDGSGRYLWAPGLDAGKPSTLLGYSVYQAADMEAVAADALAVAFGNFKAGYTIVDRVGIRILRDPYSSKPHINFYTTKRVGGDVTNFEAIKLLKLAA